MMTRRSPLTSLFGWSVLGGALLISASATAQTIFETVDVTVANVEVVVLDGEGKPVEGLTKQDFELVVDGEVVPISNFYAESATAPDGGEKDVASGSSGADAAEPATLLLYLDQSAFSQPLTSNRLVRSLERFLKSLEDSCAHCAIGLYSRRAAELEVLSEPTLDIDSVIPLLAREKSALQRKSMILGRQLRRLERSDFVMARYMTQVHADRQRAALARLFASAASIPGRKIVAVISDLPLARVPAVEFLMADLDRSELDGVTSARSRLAAAGFAADRELDELAALANSVGVAVYPVIASGITSVQMPASAERHGSVVLTTRPLSRNLSERLGAVEGLARATGGRAQFPTNDFALPLERMAMELRSYYSLGFRLEPADRPSTIRVRVQGRDDLEIRTRSSAQVFTPEREALVQTAFGFSQSAGGPVPIEAELISLDSGRRRNRVRLSIAVPLDAILWISDGDEQRADAQILLRAVEEDGASSKVAGLPVTLRREAGERGGLFADTFDLELRSTSQDLVVAFQDRLGATLSWTTIAVE